MQARCRARVAPRPPIGQDSVVQGRTAHMRLIKIAIGSVAPTVRAVRSNVDRMLGPAAAMAAEGVTIGCFSEQVVGGYPAEDLVQWRSFLAAQRSELERFAAEMADAPTVFVPRVGVAVGGG